MLEQHFKDINPLKPLKFYIRPALSNVKDVNSYTLSFIACAHTHYNTVKILLKYPHIMRINSYRQLLHSKVYFRTAILKRYQIPKTHEILCGRNPTIHTCYSSYRPCSITSRRRNGYIYT